MDVSGRKFHRHGSVTQLFKADELGSQSMAPRKWAHNQQGSETMEISNNMIAIVGWKESHTHSECCLSFSVIIPREIEQKKPTETGIAIRRRGPFTSEKGKVDSSQAIQSPIASRSNAAAPLLL
jgi:hypothetical protein